MVRPVPFEHLQHQARRLQWLLALILMTLVFVPAVASLLIEIQQLRHHARQHGEGLVDLITARLAGSRLRLADVTSLIEAEMKDDDVASIRLIDLAGRELVRRGQPGHGHVPTEAIIRFPPAVAPLKELRVEANDGPLIPHTARVLGAHLLVAALLILVFRVPMRALRDAITEVEAAHAQLIHSEKLGAIGEMYASFTHEINNPLGIILSRVKLMLATGVERASPADLVRDLEMIDRHGSRIAEIIRGLLAFARRTSFDLSDTNVNHVIADVVALVETPFAKQGITIACALDTALPELPASADHLQQVFMNLLNNARDAMPTGGTITVRTHRNDRYAIVEVKDSGAGVAQEIQGRIFEPFFTTKDVGKGTGLGLSVSYGIVRAHGGDIDVESRPGDGATFRLRLPLRAHG